MKLTKNLIRNLIREEIDNIVEQKAEPAKAKAVTDALDKAPGLQAAIDKVADPHTGGAVLQHFLNKLTAKGMDKSKLVKMMTAQFQATKQVKATDVGAKPSAAPGAAPGVK